MKKLFFILTFLSISHFANAWIVIYIDADQCRSGGYLNRTISDPKPNGQGDTVYSISCSQPGTAFCGLTYAATPEVIDGIVNAYNISHETIEALFANMYENIDAGETSGTIVNSALTIYYQKTENQLIVTIH